MPLRFDVEEYLGTNADQSRSNEYCYYCLKDGEYIVDIPMEKMVDIWVKYTDKYNEYSNTKYTPQQLRILLNKRLPALKRWKQKQTTQSVHFESIERTKTHINKNLEKDIQVEELCRIANLSFYHFRRIFKNITGENISAYIQRLRLENTAHKAISTNLPINEIVKHSCYQTKASLAKAFHKHFGMSMSAYRVQYQDTLPGNESLSALQPEIKKLDILNAICYEVGQTFRNKNEYMAIWKKLINYRDKHIGKENTAQFISISMDNPQVTLTEQCRFYLGIVIKSKCNIPKGKFNLQEIPAGLYAVFTHTGSYTKLPEIYQDIYEKWLPQSGYIQRDTMSFETYLNSPYNSELSELITEVYIRVEKSF